MRSIEYLRGYRGHSHNHTHSPSYGHDVERHTVGYGHSQSGQYTLITLVADGRVPRIVAMFFEMHDAKPRECGGARAERVDKDCREYLNTVRGHQW